MHCSDRATGWLPGGVKRRATLGAALSGLCCLLLPISARAEAPSAPIAVLARIATRILPFERGFAERSKDGVVFVVVESRDSADSASAAGQMTKELSDIGKVSGKPIRVHTVQYTTAQELAEQCKNRRAVAIFITPGFGAEVGGIARALVNTGILSVAAVESYVPRGAVLGVEIAAGKPRMSINLKQAKAQKLDFPSAVLKLARIY